MSGISPIISNNLRNEKNKKEKANNEPCGTPVNKVSQEEDDESILTKDEWFVK